MDINTIEYILDNIAIVIEFLAFFSLLVAICVFIIFLFGFINKYDRYIKEIRAEGKTKRKGPLIETIYYVVLIASVILVCLYSLTKIPNLNTESMIMSIFTLAVIGNFFYDNFNFVHGKKFSKSSFNYDYLIDTLTKWNNLFKQILITFSYVLAFLFLLFISIRFF